MRSRNSITTLGRSVGWTISGVVARSAPTWLSASAVAAATPERIATRSSSVERSVVSSLSARSMRRP